MAEENTCMPCAIGLFAHVDAGKTTLSEQILFRSHAIRKAGRVDHGDTMLDSHPIERARGITVFAGSTDFTIDGRRFSLLDTPGHADFQGEAERAASVLDLAVLVVSAAEGVESHTVTLWKMLERLQVPVVFFLNKCDREGADPDRALSALKKHFSSDAADFRGFTGEDYSAVAEFIAERDEDALDALLSGDFTDAAAETALRRLIWERKIFPVFSGAALTGDGVDGFLSALSHLSPERTESADAPFSAACWKVMRDGQNVRVCCFRALSGRLDARGEVPTPAGPMKPGELRIYRGEKFETVRSVSAGQLFAATGMGAIRPGDCIGAGADEKNRFLSEPMLTTTVQFPEGVHYQEVLEALRVLEDEEPSIRADYRAQDSSISLAVVGMMQLEIVQQLMQERFSIPVSFGPCRVLYRETVDRPAVGAGHYEPLRHYAEAWLRIVPTAPGSGISFRSRVHVDDLALNWQRLIETHVMEKQHKGVLTGSPLTDVRVELLAGRDHLKHTEGGDFREAVYRAIRNALMRAENVLLEPLCRFTLTYPGEAYGRIAGDLARMRADTETEFQGDEAVTTGEARFQLFSAWQQDFASITRGRGAMSAALSRYVPCEEQEKVVAEIGYNPLADDTPDSVFCAKGAGFVVKWDEVLNWTHLSPVIPVD